MRVISQDGTMDFPYEISTFFIYPRTESIIAIQSAGDSEISIVGRYSSKEKAIKAMEMLREQYKKYVGASVNIYGIFQFPQDDEIEV